MIEIERKFLVNDVAAALASATSASEIAQGYLSTSPDATVRVRIRDDHGFLTVKSKNHGIERGEWEYEIPVNDARELLTLSQTPVLRKVRHLVPFKGFIWEVDVFSTPAGLVLAEVELPTADTQPELPVWLGPEVTGNPAYYNSNLMRSPHSENSASL